MTIIIAYTQNDKSYIGCDSLLTEGDRKLKSSFKKIARNGNILCGVTGSAVDALDFLEKFKNMSFKKGDSDLKMLNSIYSFKLNSYSSSSTGKDVANECDFEVVVSVNGRTFTMPPYGGIMGDDKICTAGSGEKYGLGAMYALELSDFGPLDKIANALHIVADASITCGGPFYLMDQVGNEIMFEHPEEVFNITHPPVKKKGKKK